ncbi:MAG: nuclear transport factor 2 family protein [Actinobacteria bacterium]|nr:nuclear transport factor 2 family protein [Actinomycetota bacterium]
MHRRVTLACADFGKENPAIAQPRDLDALRGANAAFYSAFEGRDLDAMSRLWEHTERVVCTHPGWATLRGWAKVSASFFALFQNSQHLQFILTNERAEVVGDAGWVSVDENILDVDGATTVAALNVFVRDPDGRWVMVAHHGSPVTASAEVSDEEDDEEED